MPLDMIKLTSPPKYAQGSASARVNSYRLSENDLCPPFISFRHEFLLFFFLLKRELLAAEQ